MLVVVGLLAAGLVIALIAIGSGVYNVAADHPHYAPEKWLFVTVRERSVAVRADTISVPEDLDSGGRVNAGVLLYEQHCAICHLHPGMTETPLSRGLNPQPPRLARWSAGPAETFWVVKHGIRSTGMPAWGRTLDDGAIWSLVAFQRRLVALDARGYEMLLERAREQVQRQEKTRRGTAGQ